MTKATATSPLSLRAHEEGYDPIEDRLRANSRATIEAVFEEELEGLLGRCRYGRESASQKGYRNGHRKYEIIGTFGSEKVSGSEKLSVPRAPIAQKMVEPQNGAPTEWRSHRMALQGIAPLSTFDEEGGSADCGGVFVGDQHAPGKARALWIVQGRCEPGRGELGVVIRAWRKVAADWEAWCPRDLADEDIVRLILDGTVVKTRMDRKATNILVFSGATSARYFRLAKTHFRAKLHILLNRNSWVCAR